MPILDGSVQKFIDDYLVAQNIEREKLHEPSGKLSASMLFQPVRFQVMKSLGIPRRDIEPYVLGKFKRGSDVEEWYVDMLDKMGVLVEKQKPLEYRGVVGFADAVIDSSKMEFKKGIIPHEVKSVTNAKLKRIANSEVDYHYKLQGALYALAMKSEYFAIDILSAEDLRVTSYAFPAREMKLEIDKIIDLYDSSMNAWEDTGMLPALDQSPKIKWVIDPKYAMYDPNVWSDNEIKKYLKEKNV